MNLVQNIQPVNFEGTDTLAALVAAEEYYGEFMAGYSLPATEHSTMTTWGRENEVGAVRQVFFISFEIFHRREVWEGDWGVFSSPGSLKILSKQLIGIYYLLIKTGYCYYYCLCLFEIQFKKLCFLVISVALGTYF